jgi:hypothetical protein
MSAASLDQARWSEADVVLLDIEGTISSISFVKDVMYPYALDSLTRLARNSWADPDFQTLIAAFPHDTKQSPDALLAHVQDLTRQDIKAVYLKQLQGGFTNEYCFNRLGNRGLLYRVHLPPSLLSLDFRHQAPTPRRPKQTRPAKHQRLIRSATHHRQHYRDSRHPNLAILQ